MELTPVHTLNLTSVLSVSKRIILARYSHFISLSFFFFFFFPLSFSLVISPTIMISNHQKLLLPFLFYTLIISVLALCAVGTITYSTHNSFFGEPVKFFDSLKSLAFSFFPLLSTAIAAHVLIGLISISMLLLMGAVVMLARSLGFVIDNNSVWFLAMVGVILIAIMMYFYVEWSLAFVVVVVESKWGFAPLMRSSYLVKGMRSVSLLVMLYIGGCGVLIVGICSENFNDNITWPFLAFNMMLGSFFIMIFLLRITAANTVLYNYCKVLRGELALDVGEGFLQDYMNLPSDS